MDALTGALKMTDIKLTDQLAGHEIAGHEIARHDQELIAFCSILVFSCIVMLYL